MKKYNIKVVKGIEKFPFKFDKWNICLNEQNYIGSKSDVPWIYFVNEKHGEEFLNDIKINYNTNLALLNLNKKTTYKGNKMLAVFHMNDIRVEPVLYKE